MMRHRVPMCKCVIGTMCVCADHADQNLANPPQALPGAPASWSCAGCPQGCQRGWWI